MGCGWKRAKVDNMVRGFSFPAVTKVTERLKHSSISLNERRARLADETFLIIFYVDLSYLGR